MTGSFNMALRGRLAPTRLPFDTSALFWPQPAPFAADALDAVGSDRVSLLAKACIGMNEKSESWRIFCTINLHIFEA